MLLHDYYLSMGVNTNYELVFFLFKMTNVKLPITYNIIKGNEKLKYNTVDMSNFDKSVTLYPFEFASVISNFYIA